MLPHSAWKLCQTFLVHGLIVAAVLVSDEWMHVPRGLDCVDIFAGVGSILADAAEKCLWSATHDSLRIPGVIEHTEDITTLQGFRERLRWCCGWFCMAFCDLPLTARRGSF